MQASRLLRNVKAQEYLEELRRQTQSEAVLTKRARMDWLSRVVTKACGGRGVRPVPGGDDERVRREGRMPDKLRAVQELNKMDGAYTPEEVKVTTDLSFKALLKGLKSSELVGGKKEGRGYKASREEPGCAGWT